VRVRPCAARSAERGVMRLRKSWARSRNRGPPAPPVERGERRLGKVAPGKRVVQNSWADGRRKYPRRSRKSSFKPVESDQFQIGPCRSADRSDCPKSRHLFSLNLGARFNGPLAFDGPASRKAFKMTALTIAYQSLFRQPVLNSRMRLDFRVGFFLGLQNRYQRIY
jgi:hypothetical protein